jgi:hypothetical protein
MRLKQPQNEVRLSSKPTPKARGIQPRCNTRGEYIYKDKGTWLAWEMRLA